MNPFHYNNIDDDLLLQKEHSDLYYQGSCNSRAFTEYCFTILHDNPSTFNLAIEILNRCLIQLKTINVQSCLTIAEALTEVDIDIIHLEHMMKIILSLGGKLLIFTSEYFVRLTSEKENNVACCIAALSYTNVKMHNYKSYKVAKVIVSYCDEEYDLKDDSGFYYHPKGLDINKNSILSLIVQSVIYFGTNYNLKGMYLEALQWCLNHPVEEVELIYPNYERIDYVPLQRIPSPFKSRYITEYETTTILKTTINSKHYTQKATEVNKNTLPSILKEIAIGCSLIHPNLRQVYYVDWDVKMNTVNTLMTYYTKTLDSLIYSDSTWQSRLQQWKRIWIENKPSMFAKIFLEDRRSYAKDLLSGLSYLHSYGIIHRDIKSDNIMIDDDIPKDAVTKSNDNGNKIVIIDYGNCSLFNTYKQTFTMHYDDVLGSIFYRDYNLLVNADDYGFFIDIWACAILLLEMEVGCLPSGAVRNEKDLSENIANVFGLPNKERYDWRVHIQEKYFFNVISQMLDFNPDRRPSALMCLKAMLEC